MDLEKISIDLNAINSTNDIFLILKAEILCHQGKVNSGLSILVSAKKIESAEKVAMAFGNSAVSKLAQLIFKEDQNDDFKEFVGE